MSNWKKCRNVIVLTAIVAFITSLVMDKKNKEANIEEI